MRSRRELSRVFVSFVFGTGLALLIMISAGAFAASSTASPAAKPAATTTGDGPGRSARPPADPRPAQDVLPEGVVQLGSQAQPKSLATLLSEGFEGAFPTSPWAVWHPTSGAAAVDWGRTTYRKASGSYSIWCAGAGAQSPSSGGDVPVNTASWAIAGPFNLASASGGTFEFDLWLETESGFDYFKWMASFDGTNFSGLQTSTSTSGWNHVSQDLTDWGSAGNVTGHAQVWIAFLYDSDESEVREGAYVDNVVLSTGGGGGSDCGTYVLTADNDDNQSSGQADGDWGYCLYNNDAKHPIDFRFDINETNVTSAQLLLLCNDVDQYTEPNNPEIDEVYLNDTLLGTLTGANDEDSTTIFNVPPSALLVGRNWVDIKVNQNPGSSPDDWCVEVKQAQLIINGGCSGTASCRSVNTDRGTYSAGDTVRVTYEIDSSLSSQQIRVESNLVNPDGVIVAGSDSTYTTSGSNNDAKSVNLVLPANATSGTYRAQVLVFDAGTGQLETTCEDTFTVTGSGGACSVTCNATVPATAQVGTQITLQGSATATGCTSAIEYFWFPDNDNTTLTVFDRTATWVYDAPGTYSWLFVAVADNARCERSGTITVTGGGTATCDFSYWITVASRAAGANNSLWRTDAGLLNLGSQPATVELRYFGTPSIPRRTTTLGVGAQSILVDVVGWIQSGLTGSGAIEVCSNRPLAVTSRTYNQLAGGIVCFPTGTLGQGLDGLYGSEGVGAGQSVYIPHLVENSAFRTNIGYTNMGTGSAGLTVRLYSGNGTLLTSYNVTLAPGQWRQDTQPFRSRAGQTNMNAGWAKVTVNSGAGVVIYGSVVDNVTNDPTTVRMRQ